jgi:hypothetical protein
MHSGAENVIGLTPGMVIPGDAVSITNSRSIFASKSSPDTGLWSTEMGGGLADQSAHEFGHLLGLVHSGNPSDLMDTELRQLYKSDILHATRDDFRSLVGVTAFSQTGGYLSGLLSMRSTLHAPDPLQIKMNNLWLSLTHKN